MDERTFNREKMQWLNAVSKECEIKPTAFRIAYLIADLQHRKHGFAWPSMASLAKAVCMTTKSVHRAVHQLEEAAWLDVERKANNSNRYRLRWPPGRRAMPASARQKADKNVSIGRHRCPPGSDANVVRTYLSNQTKSYLTGLGEGSDSKRFKDRGKYEAEIIRRYGSNMIELFEKLDKIDPTAVEQLCRKAQNGTLNCADIGAAELSVAQKSKELDL